jgi:predicted DNA-binding transcriptional regulator AlpA
LGEAVKMKNDRNNCEISTPQTAPGVLEHGEQRWLSYAQVAERTGVCARTIRRDVDAGELPKPIKIRGCVRFDWPELEAALKARKQDQVHGKG